jgi:hypothetical protein
VNHPAAWHPDPTGKHDHRWWDGERWTEHVADAGQASVDPLDVAPSPPGGGDAGSGRGADATAGEGGLTGGPAGTDQGRGWQQPGAEGQGWAGGDRGQGGPADDQGQGWASQGGQASPGGQPQGWQGGATSPGADQGAQGWQGGQQDARGWQGDQQGAQGWQGGGGSGGGAPVWEQGGGGSWQGGGGTGTAGTDGVAVAALIVGILALLVSWIPVLGAIGGIVALVLGLVARNRIKKSGAGGNGMAVTGIVTGAVSIAINIAIIAFFVIAGGDFFDEVSTYVECVEETGDQAECQRQLEEGLLER